MSRHIRYAARTAILASAGLAFFMAGAAKAASGEAFAENIAAYRMLPDSAVSLLACALPGIEIAAAGALIVPRLRPAALLLLQILTATFLITLCVAAARGLSPGCDCFGDLLPHATTREAILRDALLLALLLVAGKFERVMPDDPKTSGPQELF